jgi:predicted ABC-type exoprotein transport system permease subunit
MPVHTRILELDSPIGLFIQRLGYAGLIPFVVFALLIWLVSPDVLPLVAIAMAGYGAMVVAFLGGIHWGIGLRHDSPQRRFHMVWGVVASVLAWIAVIMPAYAGLPLLGVLLVACYLVDRKTWPAAGLGEWLTLRFRLTVIATLSCLFGAGAT